MNLRRSDCARWLSGTPRLQSCAQAALDDWAVVDTIPTTLFGIAGLWLAGLGIDALIVSSGHGAGQWLSAAPVALAAGLVFGLRLVRDVSAAR